MGRGGVWGEGRSMGGREYVEGKGSMGRGRE